MSKNLNAQKTLIVLGLLWNVFVVSPIWFVLFFVTLNALGDNIPVWGWLLYWIYVPSNILGVVLYTIARLVFEDHKKDL